MASASAMVDIKETFGSAYIGAMIMMMCGLYGMTCLQTYLFFFHYPKDTVPTKLLVHVGQCHGLSGSNWWITTPTSVLILSHFGFGIETMTGFFIKKEFRHLPQLTYIAALPFAVTAVLSDIVITVALCYLLQNRKTTFRSTNTLLNTLIIYTYAINRCLLTSIMAVTEVIVFVSLPGTFWFLAFDFTIGKCYVNSLLATLNSRRALRGRGLETESGPELSTLEGFNPTALEIACVTLSMLSRSRMPSQIGRASSSFDDASRTAETRSTELKDLKTPMEEVQLKVSVVSPSEGCSSFTFEQRDK